MELLTYYNVTEMTDYNAEVIYFVFDETNMKNEIHQIKTGLILPASLCCDREPMI